MNPSEYLALPYKRFLIRDEEMDAFTAGIEEFEGCIADSKTREEALEKLEINALAWLELELEAGRPIPPPSILEEPTHSGRLSLRLPPALHQRAAEWAKANNTSLNTTLVSAVAYFFGAKDALRREHRSWLDANVELATLSRESVISIEYDRQPASYAQYDLDLQDYYHIKPSTPFDTGKSAFQSVNRSEDDEEILADTQVQ